MCGPARPWQTVGCSGGSGEASGVGCDGERCRVSALSACPCKCCSIFLMITGAGALFVSSDIQASWKSLVAAPTLGYPNHISSGRLLETSFLLLHGGRLRSKTLFTG